MVTIFSPWLRQGVAHHTVRRRLVHAPPGGAGGYKPRPYFAIAFRKS